PAPAPPPPPGPSRASRSPRSASALRRESLMASPPSVGRGRSTRGGRRDLHRADQGPAELTELAIHVLSLPTIVLAPLRCVREAGGAGRFSPCEPGPSRAEGAGDPRPVASDDRPCAAPPPPRGPSVAAASCAGPWSARRS